MLSFLICNGYGHVFIMMIDDVIIIVLPLSHVYNWSLLALQRRQLVSVGRVLSANVGRVEMGWMPWRWLALNTRC